MPKYATQTDYDALTESHSDVSNRLDGMMAEAQDHAFELGFARAQQLERERIVQVLVKAMGDGGINGFNEADLRELINP